MMIIGPPCGGKRTVRALVQECGADINTLSKQGFTPVMGVLKNGHWETASCLVAALEADRHMVRTSASSAATRQDAVSQWLSADFLAFANFE